MLAIIDNVIMPGIFNQIVDEVPKLINNPATVRYNNHCEFKNALDFCHIPPSLTRNIFDKITMVARGVLEKFVPNGTLEVDPSGRGCGLHHMPPGGFLDLHYDGNWHPVLEKLRFASAVFYLSGDEGSPFYFNDSQIAFRPNRLVIFTTDNALHGVPVPVTTDRYTLSQFFYIDGIKPREPRRAFFPNALPEFTQTRTPLP